MDEDVASTDINLEFLAGGGAMGARLRAYLWAGTTLGEPRAWPQGLRTALRIVLTTSHPMLIFWGPEHACLYNDAFARLVGPDEHPSLLGTTGRAICEESWPFMGPQVEQVMRGEGASGHEHQRVPKMGHGQPQDAYWAYSLSPIDEPDAPHGVGGVLVICTETTERVRVQDDPSAERDGSASGTLAPRADVTTRAAADRARALERARLDYVTRLSGVGFWYCDLPDGEPKWDDRVKDHFFLEPSDRITIEGFYDRIHEDDRGPIREAVERSIRDRTAYDVVSRAVHPTTGAVKWIRALGGASYASDGTPTHFDGVTIDITAQKLDQQRLSDLNEQLSEQDRRKDEFIATLSHELRNPLAPIRAAAKVIASPRVGPAQLQRAQVIIERQVTHMALLLEDLLDIARITQGKLQLKMSRVPLFDMVDAAVEAVRPALNEKNHQLLLRLPDEPVLLDADPVRVAQILSNLLLNAAKYSDPGKSVELACTVEDGTLTLVVSDQGVGIAAESIAGIFKMFSQIDGVAGRSDGGLGIGLALVKGLAELHGGTVQARSAGLGQGSEFVVRLPLAPRDAGAYPQPTDPPPAKPVRRRILIADDNRDAAESLSMLLELAGHEVRVAHRGRAALSLAQAFRPDTALLDIGMADLSGYEVARDLRREVWAGAVQLIALTGWGQEVDRRRAMEAGFDHHLVKPVDPEQLESLIAGRSP